MVLGSVLVLAVCTCVLGSPLTCLDCPATTDPGQCTKAKKCANGESCAMEVHARDGQLWYINSCIRKEKCSHSVHSTIIGRRAGSHFDHKSLLCRECCSNSLTCSRHLCPTYLPITTPSTITPPSTTPSTTTPSTTTPSTTTPSITTPSTTTPSTTTSTSTSTPASITTVVPAATATMTIPNFDPACRDREEDGIPCSSLDIMHNLCADKSSLAYIIAHKKCPKHCGICQSNIQSSQAMPPPSGVCDNFEQDGIKCEHLDLVHICTDTSTLGYLMSRIKCPKHCGVCHTNPATAAAIVAILTTPTTVTAATTATATAPTTTTLKTRTGATSPATSTSAAPTTPTSSTASAQVVKSTIVQSNNTTPGAYAIATSTVNSSCVDIEDNVFTCAAWAASGYCLSSSGRGYHISLLRCRKHCGLCGVTAP